MYSQNLKKNLLYILLGFIGTLQAQTSLTSGDIAIIGINADGEDRFSFVVLTDITSGTEILFTDNGVMADGSFRNNEGVVRYVAPNAISAGTILSFTGITGDFSSLSGSLVLSTSGDQVIAFTGSVDSPTFIFAAQTNSTEFQTNSNDSNQSDLPPGLIVGTTAVAVGAGTGAESEFDNSVYNMSVVNGNKETLLAAIANNANWNGSNSEISLPPPGNFSVGNTPPPTTVNVKGNNTVITDGDTTPSTADNTDFGSIQTNTLNAATFTVENNTANDINITAINITGDNAFLLDDTSITLPTAVATNASQNFTINFSSTATGVSNATVEVITSANNITFNITALVTAAPEIVKIHTIQGTGTSSPLVDQTVTIEGIIVGDFQDGTGSNGDLNGFFIQEEDIDADNNSASSEGIFVFDGFSPETDVTIGDKVSVSGTVSEFFGSTQISNVTAISIISSGNALPAAALVSLPLASTVSNSDNELIPDLENIEGMRATFPQTLIVTELFQLDRFGEIRLTQGNRLEQFTQNNEPSIPGFAAHLQDIASRSIILDDGMNIQNPDPIVFPDGALNSSDAFRMGNTTVNLTGVVAYSRGSGGSGNENYRIHPTVTPTFTAENTRDALPADVGGTLKVAGFNVLNYFTTLDTSGTLTAIGNDPRGADTTTEFDRQREKLLNALVAIDADIFGLIELENDFLASSPGNAIEDIVTGLNDLLGANTYDWVNPDTQFAGDDTIAMGMIYKPSSVVVAIDTTVEILDDSDLNALGLGSLPAVFNGNSTNRSPVAATFTENTTGEKFTVIVNHFKSKGSPGTASSGDIDQNDGAGNANQTRLNGAIALNAWINSDPTNSGDADFLILGDLNAYAKEDPITFLEEEGFTDLARNFNGSSAYSFVFDGQTGTLDYAMANSTLVTQVTGTTEWHINADEADAIDYNLDFSRNSAIFNGSSPFRSSDHDPIIVGLALNSVVLNNDVFTNNETPDTTAYPVPFKDELTISTGYEKESVVKLFNLTGQLVFEYTVVHSKTISTEHLNTGVYILMVSHPEGEYSEIIIKE